MRRWVKRLKWTGVIVAVLVGLNFGYKAMLPYWYQKGIDVSHHNGRIDWAKVDGEMASLGMLTAITHH